MLAKVERELFQLECQRMRFAQRHRFELVFRPALEESKGLEDVAPPERFEGRFRFRNVDTERMPQPVEVEAIDQQGQVEQRSRGDIVRIDARL